LNLAVVVKLPPAAVTSIGPVTAREGTVAVILVAETILKLAEKPFVREFAPGYSRWRHPGLLPCQRPP
jgi:hypothetical protein